MKKRYSTKQISEAISYWKTQLKKMDEGIEGTQNLMSISKEFINAARTLINNGYAPSQIGITIVDDKAPSAVKEWYITNVDEVQDGILGLIIQRVSDYRPSMHQASRGMPLEDFIQQARVNGVKKMSSIFRIMLNTAGRDNDSFEVTSVKANTARHTIEIYSAELCSPKSLNRNLDANEDRFLSEDNNEDIESFLS